MPSKKGITEQEDYSEYEHLGRQEPEHSGRDGEARSFADVARDLRELDPCEMYLLAGQMRSILRDVAEELPNSAIGSGCAPRLHG